MGARPSIVQVSSRCSWVPPSTVESEVENIIGFNSSPEVEAELLENLRKRVTRVVGVAGCTVDYQPKGWFRPRKVNIAILPVEGGPQITGSGAAKRQLGLGGKLRFIGPPSTSEFGVSYLPGYGVVSSARLKYPLTGMMDLKRKNPVPFVHVKGEIYTYTFNKYPYKTFELKAKYIPYEKALKTSVYYMNRSMTAQPDKQNEEKYLTSFFDYHSFGVKASHKLMIDNLDLYGADQNLMFKVHNYAKLLIVTDTKSTIPAIQYKVSMQGLLPPNVLCRAEAGSLLSTSALPYPERYHLGGRPILRGVDAQKFSPKFNRTYTGIEHYIAATQELRFPVSDMLNMYLFNSNAVGVNIHRTHPAEKLPGFVKYGGIGIGFVVSTGLTDIEVNFSVPYMASPNMPICHFCTLIAKKD